MARANARAIAAAVEGPRFAALAVRGESARTGKHLLLAAYEAPRDEAHHDALTHARDRDGRLPTVADARKELSELPMLTMWPPVDVEVTDTTLKLTYAGRSLSAQLVRFATS